MRRVRVSMRAPAAAVLTPGAAPRINDEVQEAFGIKWTNQVTNRLQTARS